LETCVSFAVRKNRATHHLEIVRERRKCLHFYFYYFDAEFGFMHVRLQSWFPFTIQVYINGREWLARQLAQQGSEVVRYSIALHYLRGPRESCCLGSLREVVKPVAQRG
jgi:hypothetical protein